MTKYRPVVEPGLLPSLTASKKDPKKLAKTLHALFEAMALGLGISTKVAGTLRLPSAIFRKGVADSRADDIVNDMSADGRRSVPATLIGTVRYPRLVPKDAECAKELKKRTLTNLDNQRPTWLDLAHQRLDAAVFAAYGWPISLTDDDLLAKLLALNLERSG